MSAFPRSPTQIATLLVEAMGDDNGCCFRPNAEQLERLTGGLARMMVAGCAYTNADIDLFAAGEHGEMLDTLERFDGFKVAEQAMIDIFDELPTLSRREAHQEILDLFARNTGDHEPTEDEKDAINEGLTYLLSRVAPTDRTTLAEGRRAAHGSPTEAPTTTTKG